MPLPNCPAPDVALSLALRVWWARKPLEVFAAGTSALLLLASFVAFLSLSSPSSEYTATLAWGASQGLALLFYAGCAITALALFSFAFWNFGKGITIGEAAPAGQKLLGAGELPGIGSDIPILALENETPAAFAQRMADAKREAVEGQMVVALPFRSPYVVCFQKGGDSEAVLSGQSTRWAVAHKSDQVYANGADVSNETYEEYLQFVRWYADGFEAWATAQRIKMSSDPFGSLVRLMSRMSAVLLLMLGSLSVSAQGNAGKVEAYLGDVRAGMKPRGEVQYVFARRVFTRKADGTKNFVETLQTPVGVAPLDNNEALGNLLAISNNGVMLERVDAPPAPRQVEQAAATVGQGSARPLSEAQPQIQWDSATIRNGFDRTGARVKSGMKMGGQIVKAWWESELWGAILQILLMVGGLARAFAKVSFSEHRGSPAGHWYGRGTYNFGTACNMVLKACAVVFCLVFLTHFYVCAVEIKSVFGIFGYVFSLLWTWWTAFAIMWFFLLAGVEKVFSHIIPNPKIYPNNPGTPFNNHTSRLGAGDTL